MNRQFTIKVVLKQNWRKTNKKQITQIQPLRSMNIIIMGKKQNKKGKTPSFIRKLVQILEDDKFSDLVSWLDGGNGFQILNASRFSDEVLPIYFKHKNLASFIRQLNMYDFLRPKDSSQYVYSHPKFIRGNTNAMRFIARKIATGTQEEKQYDSNSNSCSQMVSTEKNNFFQIFTQLLKENQELKKTKMELYDQIQNFKKQKEDCRSLQEKTEAANRQSLENQRSYFTPIQIENGQKILQPLPCFGVFSNYLAYFP